MSEITKESQVSSEEDFRRILASKYPNATIITEDGSGQTYGEIGTLTAVIGPDMQADVVGVFIPEDKWGWVGCE